MTPPLDPSDTALTEQTFFILLSLAAAPKHGYAILKDVQSMSNERIRLSISTLYTSLKRLMEQGWIERVEDAQPDQPETNRARKEYRLTREGRRILQSETVRLQSLVQAALQHTPQDIT